MQRSAYQKLLRWRSEPRRKPLVLRGARQVGKTWLLNEFGRQEFRRAHWVNFERAGPARALFSGGLTPEPLVRALEVALNSDIDPSQDVLILDGIQQEPHALTSLKYFKEEVPDLAVCCAGSHIGLQVSEASFPVGQVDFMTLYPLTFMEFLLAHNPRAASFIEDATHINRVFANIPEQIARAVDGSVAKYRFKGVIPNRSKSAQFDGPIDWLVRAGLAIRTFIVDKPALPLRAQRRANTFKLYLLDVGLLGCLLDLPLASIIHQDYGSFKGFMAENFVAQELNCLDSSELYSWTGRASEIEFLRQIGTDIVPVEVKSGTRTRARSLSAYSEKYHPPWKIKLSARNLSVGKGSTLNIPLYLAGSVDEMRPRVS